MYVFSFNHIDFVTIILKNYTVFHLIDWTSFNNNSLIVYLSCFQHLDIFMLDIYNMTDNF